MITLFARLRIDDWQRFRAVHDEPGLMRHREEQGNLSHRVLTQLDDVTDVVFLDTWSSPQDADDYYFSDAFDAALQRMGGSIVELIKLEETEAAGIG